MQVKVQTVTFWNILLQNICSQNILLWRGVVEASHVFRAHGTAAVQIYSLLDVFKRAFFIVLTNYF